MSLPTLYNYMILVTTCFPPLHEAEGVDGMDRFSVHFPVLARVQWNTKELLSGIVGIFTKEAAV